MDDAIKALWKAKLLSGEFPQGQSWLRKWNPDEEQWEYCCLGVACEMSGLDQWAEYTNSDDELVSSYLGSDQFLPEPVAQWMQIDEDHEVGTPQSVLAEMNDEDHDFTYIARNMDAVFDGTVCHGCDHAQSAG